MKYLTNVVLLGFFVVASIFVFLFDEKLDRHEAEKDTKFKELNQNKEKEEEDEGKDNNDKLDNPETIEVKENNYNGNNIENGDNKDIAKNLLKA